MIVSGAHFLLFSPDPEADRAFLRDVLALPSVDAGHGWLIFGLPPAEIAVHPAAGENESPALYLMCDDLHAALQIFHAKHIQHGPVSEASWGIVTTLRLPSGKEIGLYQPTHPRPV